MDNTTHGVSTHPLDDVNVASSSCTSVRIRISQGCCWSLCSRQAVSDKPSRGHSSNLSSGHDNAEPSYWAEGMQSRGGAAYISSTGQPCHAAHKLVPAGCSHQLLLQTSSVLPVISTSQARRACALWSGCGGGSTTAPPAQSTTASKPSWPLRAFPLSLLEVLSGQPSPSPCSRET